MELSENKKGRLSTDTRRRSLGVYAPLTLREGAETSETMREATHIVIGILAPAVVEDARAGKYPLLRSLL